MTRDTFDNFTPPDRGRFGENESESVRGNDSVRSNLCDLTLELKEERPLSIAVVDPAKPGMKWAWLPKSQIEFEKKGPSVVEVAMPQWLAKDKGLV
jgi:hypothetical protein